jgi:glucokinase
MILAGDLGGTTTRLGLFDDGAPRPAPVVTREYATLDHISLAAIVTRFLRETGTPAAGVRATCIGVAGPVTEGQAILANVPWRVTARELADVAGLADASIINDVEAVGWAVPVLAPDELVTLHAGRPADRGNIAILTVGTGLGAALLHDVGGTLIPSPSEIGHSDYPARSDREIDLLLYLRTKHGRVDNERVVSGIGLAQVSAFTHSGRCRRLGPDAGEAAVPAHVVSQALGEGCRECVEALDIVVDSLAAVAGNLALITVATRGVYIGGGIPPRIVDRLRRPEFLHVFRAKPPMAGMLDDVPLHIIMNPHAGVLGAAVAARGSHLSLQRFSRSDP